MAEQISSTGEIPYRNARRSVRETPDKNKVLVIYGTGFVRSGPPGMLLPFDKVKKQTP